MNNFKPYPKIPRYDHENSLVTITQKMHGTNAQITIEDVTDLYDRELYIPAEETVQALNFEESTYQVYRIRAGSRTRWLTPENDNYGFAEFVYSNQLALIELLGTGTHYGEWCGPGINSGEGLKARKLFLFRNCLDESRLMPFNGEVPAAVPTLWRGLLPQFSDSVIEDVMANLMEAGSRAVPGFMKVEGIVIDIGGKKYKKVFSPENTQWKSKKQNTARNTGRIDVSHLLQPIRLDNLLTKDEKLEVNFPFTIPKISKLYLEDLIAEEQISADDKPTRKALAKAFIPFLRAHIAGEE